MSSSYSSPDLDFKVADFFEIKYVKNDARYSHSYYWTLINRKTYKTCQTFLALVCTLLWKVI